MGELQERRVVELIRDKKRFAQLEKEWNRLAEPLGSPLMCHDWLFSCAEAFHNDGDLRIVVLWSDGKVVAAAPLAAKKRWGIEYLELLGVSYLSEPSGLLYDNEKSLKDLVNAVLEMGQPVVLQKMTGCSPSGNLLNGEQKIKTIVISRPPAGSVYIPITTTWEEFWNSLQSRRRYDFRRARKKAEKEGKITVKIMCPEYKDLSSHLEAAFTIEASGWKGRKGSAILKNERLQHFFETYAGLACKERKLRLCFLHIADDPVAMQIGVQYANRFWVLKIGYDEKWGKCSPGMQLAYETMRHAFDQGLESYEWLGTDEDWLHAWPVEIHDCTSVGFYPMVAAGLYGLGMDLSDFVFRRLARKAGGNKKIIVTGGNKRAALAINRAL